MNLTKFSEDKQLNNIISKKISRINQDSNYPSINIQNVAVVEDCYEYVMENNLFTDEFKHRSDLPEDAGEIPTPILTSENRDYALRCIFAFWAYKEGIDKSWIVEGKRFSTQNLIKCVIGGGKLYSYVEENFESKHAFLAFVFGINNIRRSYYYDIDWDEAQKLLENGLVRTELCRKAGAELELKKELIEKHIGEYERPETYTQLPYEDFKSLYGKEQELISGKIKFYEFFRFARERLDMSKGTLESYISRKDLKAKAGIRPGKHRKKITRLESLAEYRENFNTYESEVEILERIDFPVMWLSGFGADMIYEQTIIEIKRNLTQNNLYKAIIQVEGGFRELKDNENIENRAVYATGIKENAKRYWEKYSEMFDIDLFILKDNQLEKY